VFSPRAFSEGGREDLKRVLPLNTPPAPVHNNTDTYLKIKDNKELLLSVYKHTRNMIHP